MRLEDAHASVANAYLPGVADTHLDRTVDVFAGKCSDNTRRASAK
jgi:hypothetical protein